MSHWRWRHLSVHIWLGDNCLLRRRKLAPQGRRSSLRAVPTSPNYSTAPPANCATPTSKLDLRQFMSFEKWRRIFQTYRTLFLSYCRLILGLGMLTMATRSRQLMYRKSQPFCEADWSGQMSKREDRPTLDIHGAFVRRVDLSGTSLRGANMAGADATKAILRGADFSDAILRGTILRGADLTDAKNLTIEQLSEAVIDDDTLLPGYIDRAKLRALVQGMSE